VLEKIEELEPKIKALDDQLTGITARVNQLGKTLGEIERSVKGLGSRSDASATTGQS
jgi:prefoldin subunit 5